VLPLAPPGTDTCQQVLDCAFAAMTQDEAQACFDGGSEAARGLFSDFAQCFNDNMCMDVECPACADQLAACQADVSRG
jgi:hypothetical protein